LAADTEPAKPTSLSETAGLLESEQRGNGCLRDLTFRLREVGDEGGTVGVVPADVVIVD
jgi:hypothetical protein